MDLDASGVLEPAEIQDTAVLCHPVDGLSTLVATLVELPGLNCENGGHKVESGLDQNADGLLEISEVLTTTFVCDGADGVDGVNGIDGAPGVDGEDGEDGSNAKKKKGGCSVSAGSGAPEAPVAWLSLIGALAVLRRRGQAQRG